jgi:Phage tail assembly chaperone protein
MTEWVVLDPLTLSIVLNYTSETSRENDFTGYLNTCPHLQVPQGLTWDTVKGVQAEDGTVTLTEDPQKVAAKTQAQWTALRSQRDALLAASDWRVLPYSPLTSEKQAAWVTYRQALRDLPGSVTDPLNPVWPPVPSP